MAAPVEPAAEALAVLAAQPVQPAQPAEVAAPAAAPAAAEVPVEVLNPPQTARYNDEVPIILSSACSSLLVLDCLLTPLFQAFHLSLVAGFGSRLFFALACQIHIHVIFSFGLSHRRPGIRFRHGLGVDVPAYKFYKAWARRKIS